MQILLVYESLNKAEELLAVLRQDGHRPQYVCAADQTELAAVIGWPWDVVLSDLCTQDISVGDVLSRLAVRKAPPPLVVVSENIEVCEAVDAMRHGAFDVVKWSDIGRLPRVVKQALKAFHEREVVVYEDKFLQFTQSSIEKAADAVFWIDSLGRFFYVNDAAEGLLGYARRELGIMSLFDINTTISREQWPDVWSRLRQDNSLLIESTFLARDGRMFPVEMTLNLLVLDGEEYTTAYVRDITERKDVADALAAKESRYRSLFEESPISLWEEDLTEVKLFFDQLRGGGVDDFEKHFEENPDDVVECLRRVKLINVNRATVEMLEADSKEDLLQGLDKVFSVDSLRVAREEFVALAQGRFSFSGELNHNTLKGRTIRVAVHFNVAPEYRDTLGRVVVSLMDITEIRRMQSEVEAARDLLEQRVEERTKELEEANVHLRHEVAEREEAELRIRENEQRIHNLTHELLRAQEQERQRIALDLHDNVAQNLSSLKIICETLFDGYQGLDQELYARVSRLSDSLQKSIQSVRDLSYGLRPPSLDQLGLVRALDQFCREYSQQTGIDISLSAVGLQGLALGADAEINLYRLVQEALHNAMRHSQAKHVVVKLVASSPDLLLRVEDDGMGFDLNERRAKALVERRMGLESMQERARLLGGECRVTSRVDKGTKIFVKIPVG